MTVGESISKFRKDLGMMNASPFYLGCVLLVFTAFNVLFIGGFLRTAYKIGIPFLTFGIAALVVIGIAETLHHLHGLGFLNAPSGEKLGLQFGILVVSAAIYAAGTALSCRASMNRFERIDL